ncbi:MAG: transporter [Novosphingobium sp.]
MTIRLSLCALPLLLCATLPARAEEREFCADRPGLTTPPCTLAPGTAMIEVGAAAWEHSRDAASIEDDVTVGDALLRLGIADSAELQIGLTSHVTQRSKDRASGAVTRVRGPGDGMIALRRGLAGPNGPVALMGFITLPTGKPPIGAGRLEAGVLLPATISLPADFEIGLTPEFDLAANSGRGGRHPRWGGAVGLSHPLGEHLTLTGELAAFRDEDPGAHSTDARAAGSLAWQVGERFQLDVELDLGLAKGAPDRAIMLGFARRFD